MKEFFKKPRLLAALAIALPVAIVTVAVTVHAKLGDLSRMESTKGAEMSNVSSQTPEAPTEPQNKPEEKPAEPAPAPVPSVDPNGCEAKGMWYRADNNECIPKTISATPQSNVGAPEIRSTGSGDCSLVNNYDWPTATAMRVCMQESGGNPNQSNMSDYHEFANCWGSFGLMQINCSHGRLYDGVQNMAVAYQMWLGSGKTFAKHWKNTCAKVGC